MPSAIRPLASPSSMAGSQPGKFDLVLLFLALQRAQSSAHDLAGILVAAALDLRQHEAVKFVGQIDIAG